jgi:hypothetical protein
LQGPWLYPDFNFIPVLFGDIFPGGYEIIFFEDVLHYGSWHDHTEIVAIQKPLPEKCLSIAFIPSP